MRVLGFGDNIIDSFLDRNIEYPGGNAVNVAVFARRLGAEAAYVGVFGDDERAGFLRDSIEAQGVGTEYCAVKPGPSGVTYLTVVDGDRTFLSWNGGGVTVSDPIDLDDGRLAYASGFDIVHSSVYSGTEDEILRLCDVGAMVSFDFSSEPEFRTPEYLDRVAPHLDLALFSCSEMSEESARDLLVGAVRRGARVALGTRGVEGAIVTDGTVWEQTPAHLVEDPADLVDTMACGDAFVAGFIVSLLARGWSRGTPPGAVGLRSALEAGADSARDQCFVEAAFGSGRVNPDGPLDPEHPPATPPGAGAHAGT